MHILVTSTISFVFIISPGNCLTFPSTEQGYVAPSTSEQFRFCSLNVTAGLDGVRVRRSELNEQAGKELTFPHACISSLLSRAIIRKELD